MKVKSGSEVAQSCPTVSDPMDCSPPGSSIHGIFQARGLEWGTTALSVINYTPLQNGLMLKNKIKEVFLTHTEPQRRLACLTPANTVGLGSITQGTNWGTPSRAGQACWGNMERVMEDGGGKEKREV